MPTAPPPTVLFTCSALDATFRPKPEILHQHRQPERRAPAVVSLFFALVALAPLGGYVVVALRLGANLKASLGSDGCMVCLEAAACYAQCWPTSLWLLHKHCCAHMLTFLAARAYLMAPDAPSIITTHPLTHPPTHPPCRASPPAPPSCPPPPSTRAWLPSAPCTSSSGCSSTSCRQAGGVPQLTLHTPAATGAAGASTAGPAADGGTDAPAATSVHM